LPSAVSVMLLNFLIRYASLEDGDHGMTTESCGSSNTKPVAKKTLFIS